MFLVSKDAGYGKIVMFSDGEYSLKNYDVGYNLSYVPDPITGVVKNAVIEFYSREFGYCEIDWGDGTVDNVPMTKVKGSNDYRLYVRTLDIEYEKNPDSHPWWFYKEDGSEYIPVPNHHYTDGVQNHSITFTFSCDVYRYSMDRIDLRGFPILDMPSLEYLYLGFVMNCIEDIPEDRIARSSNITTLILTEGRHKMTKIPESWSKLSNLATLKLGNTGNFFDDQLSNIRKLPEMFPNLTTLDLSGCYIRTYPVEWLLFSKLSSLAVCSSSMSGAPDGYDCNTMIAMDEIDHINPTLKGFAHMGGWYTGGALTSWHDYMKGKGLENITSMDMSSNRPPFDNLPDYFFEMRAFNTLRATRCLYSQEVADAFVDMIYRGTTEWEYSTMSQTASDGKRNQFYDLYVNIYDKSNPINSLRPSGVEQAPPGFMKGVSNGNPSSPMEMVYVLKNNYSQSWSINPE